MQLMGSSPGSGVWSFCPSRPFVSRFLSPMAPPAFSMPVNSVSGVHHDKAALAYRRFLRLYRHSLCQLRGENGSQASAPKARSLTVPSPRGTLCKLLFDRPEYRGDCVQLPGLIPLGFYPLRFAGKLSFSVSSLSGSGGAGNFTLTSPNPQTWPVFAIAHNTYGSPGQPSFRDPSPRRSGSPWPGPGRRRRSPYRSGGCPADVHRATHI